MQPFFVISFCLIGLFSGIVSGQCSISWPFLIRNAVCAVDPADNNDVQLQVLPDFGGCGGGNPTASFTASMTYTDTLGAVSAVQATPVLTTTLGIHSVLSFNYDVAYTGIRAGSQVTQALIAQAPGIIVFAAIVYTQTTSQSIFYSVATSTVTSTTGTDTTVFTTTTATETDTVPGPTVTAISTTGILTVKAPRPTITSTFTFTPKPKTIHSLSIVVSSTELSCIPAGKDRDDRDDRDGHGSHRGQRRRRGLVAARQAAVSYENPNCGAITPTTLASSTSLVTTTSTTTDTITSTVETVSTAFTTGPPETTYQSVIGTSTITPSPRTKRKFTIASRATVTSTKVVTITRLIVPSKGLPPCHTGSLKQLNGEGTVSVSKRH
ncbi:hypothetical protein DM02DRAFT_652865 [Periconia macrospinosa]|uniref:Uncharacterized protein n=1 Tax=Periconia macrospinosa TaxID=97972 RepID=A0A2V1E0R9_9PLEO|nr:hypothetical protein DM02DRAFT_652865 [Periconia macrospinosa]